MDISAIPLSINNYELVFNKEINYCSEIADLYQDIKLELKSNSFMFNSQNDLSIILRHSAPEATKEVDFVLLWLSIIYYDCFVKANVDLFNKYTFHVIDGFIKEIMTVN